MCVEIVHNRRRFHPGASGAIFVETDAVPPGSLVIFSAHGVSPAVHDEAKRQNLRTIDATCPLVTKSHNEARRFAAEDYQIVLIGHAGHEEVGAPPGRRRPHNPRAES